MVSDAAQFANGGYVMHRTTKRRRRVRRDCYLTHFRLEHCSVFPLFLIKAHHPSHSPTPDTQQPFRPVLARSSDARSTVWRWSWPFSTPRAAQTRTDTSSSPEQVGVFRWWHDQELRLVGFPLSAAKSSTTKNLVRHDRQRCHDPAAPPVRAGCLFPHGGGSRTHSQIVKSRSHLRFFFLV